MAGHWFDSLARRHSRSVEATPDETARITRRTALARAGGAALALTALGPLVPDAAARGRPAYRSNAVQSAACTACVQDARRVYRRSREGLRLNSPSTLLLIGQLAVAGLLVGVEYGYFSSLSNCSRTVCDPQAMSPAASANPAIDPATGEPVCPGGTHDCGPIPGTGAHYCCFGSDLCCGGTCCIQEVGCACVG